MARTVGHVAQQAFRLSGQAKQAARHHEILDYLRSSNIIDFSSFASFENRENPPAVVVDVEPVTLLFAIAVYGKEFIVERIRDHQRQEFFRELIGTVVV